MHHLLDEKSLNVHISLNNKSAEVQAYSFYQNDNTQEMG